MTELRLKFQAILLAKLFLSTFRLPFLMLPKASYVQEGDARMMLEKQMSGQKIITKNKNKMLNNRYDSEQPIDQK